MTLVSRQLKEGVQKLFERLSSPDYPAGSVPPTVAVATMTGPQSSEARWPLYSVASDEPPSIGGTDRAPSPSSIFVASIGFAENVIFARQAALLGVDFDSLETKVEARWDIKGTFGIGGADPSITELTVETRVSSSAPHERLAEVVRLTDRRCPMTATVAKSAAVRRKLFVNGLQAAL
jgi:uncharacterized OsmC-like protein